MPGAPHRHHVVSSPSSVAGTLACDGSCSVHLSSRRLGARKQRTARLDIPRCTHLPPPLLHPPGPLVSSRLPRPDFHTALPHPSSTAHPALPRRDSIRAWRFPYPASAYGSTRSLCQRSALADLPTQPVPLSPPRHLPEARPGYWTTPYSASLFFTHTLSHTLPSLLRTLPDMGS